MLLTYLNAYITIIILQNYLKLKPPHHTSSLNKQEIDTSHLYLLINYYEIISTYIIPTYLF
jgi:hypothetical protein